MYIYLAIANYRFAVCDTHILVISALEVTIPYKDYHCDTDEIAFI